MTNEVQRDPAPELDAMVKNADVIDRAIVQIVNAVALIQGDQADFNAHAAGKQFLTRIDRCGGVRLRTPNDVAKATAARVLAALRIENPGDLTFQRLIRGNETLAGVLRQDVALVRHAIDVAVAPFESPERYCSNPGASR